MYNVEKQTLIAALQIVYYVLHISDASTVRVTATAPVNPYEEQGILSVHCQVWKITDSHEMTIFRTLHETGVTERLSVNDNILSDIDERVYLGVRKASDGSTIYFLSIMDATRMDRGEYICKVFRVSTATVVEMAAGSVNITSTYFPSDPLCAANGPLTLYAGSMLTLNCSVEIGNPIASVEWTRTGSSTALEAVQFIQDKTIYKQLSLSLTLQDTNAIFFCRITSRAYPNRVRTCHVGPIRVLSTGIAPTLTSEITTGHQSATEVSVSIMVNKTSIRRKCLQTCSPLKSNLFYWILATIILGFLAIFFLVVGIYFFVRYYYVYNDNAGQRHLDKIYTELEAEQVMYMSLKRVKDKEFDYEK